MIGTARTYHFEGPNETCTHVVKEIVRCFVVQKDVDSIKRYILCILVTPAKFYGFQSQAVESEWDNECNWNEYV